MVSLLSRISIQASFATFQIPLQPAHSLSCQDNAHGCDEGEHDASKDERRVTLADVHHDAELQDHFCITLVPAACPEMLKEWCSDMAVELVCRVENFEAVLV